ncbi:MAG TPA: hypothetical protein VHA06_22450 [Candidatus Angelobacter sp.]|nr:hypothetical protein [Candidatus Angelobacter sp.]
MIPWQSAAVEQLKLIVHGDLETCDAEQFAIFTRYAIEPYLAPIVRNGTIESVVVVARRENEVIYWEDVEEGFNVSPIDSNGQILEHWCNQDELGLALNAWIEGRGLATRVRPAGSS